MLFMGIKVSLIAAIGKNRELGKDNKLLWHIPEDLMRFKELTKGHPIIMGRKTFESIGRVLSGRLNIVITRDKQKANGKGQSVENLVYVESLEEAIEMSSKYYEVSSKYNEEKDEKILKQVQDDIDGDEIFIIGGGQIFEQAIGMADKLYLTIVEAEFEADTYFPEYSQIFTKVTFREEGKSNEYSYVYINLEK